MTFQDLTSETNASGFGLVSELRTPFALVLESESLEIQVSHLEGELYSVRLSERGTCNPGFLWRAASREVGIRLAERLAELLGMADPGQRWERMLAPSLRRAGTWGGLITEATLP